MKKVMRTASSLMLIVLLITAAENVRAQNHDIAINNVIAVETIVGQNYTTLVMAIVENQGDFTETFNVTAYYSGTAISAERWSGGPHSQTFWSMGDAVRDGYIDFWDMDLLAYHYGWSGLPGRNPADINIDGKVDLLDVLTAGSNFGVNIWTFFGIPRLISNQTLLTLPSGHLTIINFMWNTANVNKGAYLISADASQVPGETDTVDNTYVDGNVMVAMIGDINGPTPNVPDGKVDIRDVALVSASFGIDVGADIFAPGPGMTTWLQYWHPEPFYHTCALCPHNPNCDITGPIAGLPEGKIDIRDVATVAIRFGEIDP